MAPSTEQIDDLLEWHPGTPEAAQHSPLQALLWGARRAADAKLLIFWLWLFHLLLLQRGGAAVLGAMRSAASWAEAYASMVAATPTSAAFTEPAFGAGLRALMLGSIARPLWSASPYFVVFYGVLAGGAIAYLHAPRPAPLLAQLGAGCGTYVGRFVRLLALAAAASWALQSAAGLLFSAGAVGDALWWRLIMWQGSVTIVAAVMDYARVRTVARDSRSMLLETARSARFFARNLPRVLMLELALVAVGTLVGAAALVLAGALRSFLPTGPTLLIAGQAYVVALLWLRLTAWAAMLSLYQGITLHRLDRRRA